MSTHEQPARVTLADLRKMSNPELFARRTTVSWTMHSIEAQIIDPERFDRNDNWRQSAKQAMLFCRREITAINNLIAERYEQAKTKSNRSVPAVALIQKFMYLYEAGESILQDDTDAAWAALDLAVRECREFTIWMNV